MSVQKYVAHIDGYKYYASWTDTVTKEILYETYVVISPSDNIEQVTDEIWAFYQDPSYIFDPDPETYMSLAEYLEYKQGLVNEYRDNLINQGYTWNGYRFDTNETARQNITSVTTAISNGIQLPSNYVWRSADNENVPMTEQDLISLGATIMDWVTEIYGVSWYHKDTMEAIANDPNKDEQTKMSELVNYDYKVGWPPATNM